MMFNLAKDPYYNGPGTQSRVAMYSTLLFYTVGVFTVAYVLGGQTIDFAERAGELKNLQSRARYYKDQTRLHKQTYVSLTATPVGAIPNCPVCGACTPSPPCDVSGCETCPVEQSKDQTTAKFVDQPPAAEPGHDDGARRRLLAGCPPCQQCNDSPPAPEADAGEEKGGRRLLEDLAKMADAKEVPAPAAVHATSSCDKEALLTELKMEEGLGELNRPAKHEPAVSSKVQAHRDKHAQLMECLRITMPAVGEAYEEAFKAKRSTRQTGH
mmetsp:Transcript_19071/g.36440  ORF Transcript_19071/g.36440 Transcript_19071/m.36440 type:complete len:269 (+) Transcript_19071:221-1027(+)|eukprot:CAMPEP_0114257168 /NCGR_PEP_ID=MMETSP0058-20121206/18573_1 /TAXON_ID=36894 /ORGANISM="Pyramimonas parkeae, CCMP726" /LENGTH=268 /DNA_ID=CAMNT_0001371845 /DNA_START=221 /DNA_END=1027 /DNA_ORIENTATION=-